MIKFERIKNWRPLAAYITSGHGEDNEPDCKLCLYLWWFAVYIKLPGLIKPEEKRVVPNWDAATIARLGRDYYINYTRRDYGFMFGGEGHFQLFLGRQTDDSSTEQCWSCFLPWTQWRYVRSSVYDLQGEFRAEELETVRAESRLISGFDRWAAVRKATPKAIFCFWDFDGDFVEAETMIEQREWERGTGWCKWLSWFWPRKIRRSLNIQFNKETGKRKGSWKGGTLGHGIDLLPGELHEAGFRRYCQAHGMTYVGRIWRPEKRETPKPPITLPTMNPIGGRQQ